MNSTEKAEAVQKGMQYASMGSENIYQHPFGVKFTDGIKMVADTCEAWWLIDAVASWQGEINKKHVQHARFQCWRLAQLDGGEWVLEAWSDTPGMEADPEDGSPASVRLAVQEIPFSDFPPELSPFEWWVEHGTMLLKEEH